MNRATQKMRDFASQLIALESKGKKVSDEEIIVNFPVPEKLRPTLSTLMGNAGFRTLLARALTLATAEVPWLRVVKVNPAGALEGWEELHAQLGSEKFLEGRIVLLAHLLGLLVAFIGEKLTVRLVREVWPKLSLNDNDLNFG